MNTTEMIQEWAKNCGYTGPIPKVMTSFCNENSLHVWNDIMMKVKPRREVEQVHRKLIIHRLKTGLPLQEAMQREYDIYHKLQTLSNFKEDSLTGITQKQMLLKKSQKRIKDNKFELERINASMESMEMANFLLEEKTNSYAENSSKIQSKSNFIENTVFYNKTTTLKEQKTISDSLREYANKIDIDTDMNTLKRKRVADLLHSHRNAVFHELYDSEKALLQDLRNIVEACENISVTNAGDDNYKYNDEKFRLYAKCLEHDIEAKMHEQAIEKLQSSVQNYKTSCRGKLQSQMYSSADIENIMKSLDEQATLASQDTQLKKKIVHLTEHLTLRSQNYKNLDDIKSDLQAIHDSINTISDNISTSSEKVSRKRASVEMAKTKSKAALEMLLGINLDYSLPMKDDIMLNELVVFRDYPLEYYKHNDNGGKSNPNLNKHLSTQPCSTLLSELNSSPLQTPWELLTTIKKDLQYLAQLITAVKSTSSLLPSDVKPVSISVDFKHNDETVQKLVDDLQSGEQQMNLRELRLQKNQFQQMLADWLGLRFGEFMSPERLFDGKNFENYEKEFRRYYNML